MSPSFGKKLAKTATTLAVICGIALGLCGLNAGLFSVTPSLPAGLHNLLVMIGVVELVTAGICLLGLIIVGVIAIAYAVSGSFGREKNEDAP